jgi:4-diphosphocytidyl-2-C-methyl-D-erythritol kinase
MSVTEFAPAKVNLGLAVLGKLESGYHELDSLFVTFNVGDTLTFEARNSGIELEIVGLDLPTNRENLVYRAAEMYLENLGNPGGVSIKLEKILPIAAGLGGGSSDAAATLRGISRLYPSDQNLFELAKKLGADVPFLIEGGAARVQGFGEILEPLKLPKIHLVLANPGVGITAREAYHGLNGRYGAKLELQNIIAALTNLEIPPYRNDLEAPVLEAYPIVGEVKFALEQAGLYGVLMSGSGSTCFGLAKTATSAREIAAKIKLEHPNWWVSAASHYAND